MTIRRERVTGPSTGMTATVLAVVRIALAAIARLVLMLSGLLFGAFLGAGVLLWKLFGGRRGRTPNFSWNGMRTVSRPSATHSDVIDVEVRDVSPPI